jgi:hypothetical protein
MRRPGLIIAALTVVACLSGCGPQMSETERHRQANTAAGKLGQAAQKASVQAQKASKTIGRELRQAARDAHEGWKESAQKGK